MNGKKRLPTPWLALSLLLIGGSATAESDPDCNIKVNNDNDRRATVYIYAGSDSSATVPYNDEEVSAGSSWNTDCGVGESRCKLRWRPTILTANESSDAQNYGIVSVNCGGTYSITADHS